MSDQTALEEAKEWKAIFERTVLSELKRFTDASGLLVTGINVRHVDVPTIDSTTPQFVYAVELEIKV